MVIEKVMNNSLILSKDDNNEDIIITGKGIGFCKKVGDTVDIDKIEKIFVVKDDNINEYADIIGNIPSQYIDVTFDIIEYAKKFLNKKFNDRLLITLADHICFAVERYNKGILLQNKLMWEIKKFYPDEFNMGIYAVDYISRKINVNLPEEEASNIALHFVNAQNDEMEMQKTMEYVKMQKDILGIIQHYFHINLNMDNIDSIRLLTHLQFFLQRVIENKVISKNESYIFEMLKEKYPKQYECVLKIKRYLKTYIDIDIEENEMVYLMIHIVRITDI